MDIIHKIKKSFAEKSETQTQETSAANAAVGELTGKDNEATTSPNNSAPASSQSGAPSTEVGQKQNIAADLLVQFLMTSAIAGWQLYAMSRGMFDELPMYTAEEKTAHFGKIAKQAITDGNGDMVAFKAIDTITTLRTVVLPFWLARINAEKELKAMENESNGQKNKNTETDEVKG